MLPCSRLLNFILLHLHFISWNILAPKAPGSLFTALLGLSEILLFSFSRKLWSFKTRTILTWVALRLCVRGPASLRGPSCLIQLLFLTTFYFLFTSTSLLFLKKYMLRREVKLFALDFISFAATETLFTISEKWLNRVATGDKIRSIWDRGPACQRVSGSQRWGKTARCNREWNSLAVG